MTSDLKSTPTKTATHKITSNAKKACFGLAEKTDAESTLFTLPHVKDRKRPIKPAKHAAVTIISKNYFAFAKTLAESYKAHHPEHDFLIILVDKADGHLTPMLPCGAEVIEFSNLQIPDIERFIYRYSIMELNTAVKPFALSDLFTRRGYETLLYIDPDIWIFTPLNEIYDALANASIVLTPHIRQPYYDEHSPTDLSILQSGTYNLGFIGLKQGKSTRQLLDWWMTKLYRDCVVDIQNGLFVDQKWIDLIPGFFPDHKIIYHPGYNTAYWNLHERMISRENTHWMIDGQPLCFFHFSGYVPFAPNALSKHQGRHDLKSMPTLKLLTDAYSAALMNNGYEESSRWPYAFSVLENGVRLPLGLVRDIMQWASRNNVPTPGPITDPDGFCSFLMSDNVPPGQATAGLLFHFLLLQRKDVAASYPNAACDKEDPGFRQWITERGKKEFDIGDLLAFENSCGIVDYVADAFARLRENKRQDVFDEYPAMWRDIADFYDFADWFTNHGIEEMGFGQAHTVSLKNAFLGIGKILNIYFLRSDLQISFPVLFGQKQLGKFIAWLSDNRYKLALSKEEITLFFEFAMVSQELLEKMRFAYQHKGRVSKSTPNIYEIDVRRHEISSVLSAGEILKWLYQESAIDPADHYASKYGAETTSLEDFSRCSVPGLSPRKNFDFIRRLRQSINCHKETSDEINFAGFLNAPSGMGESARSMRTTLIQANVVCHEMALPHPQANYENFPDKPLFFGWPKDSAALSVTVANADSTGLLETFLPHSYWARKNVGYWVWETEELPFKFKDSEKLFDEIWTPSQYSAEAIARTTQLPVRVLPHTLDFEAIDKAKADRKRFGLPEQGTLFGFIFDPQSVIERKNVTGLVNAFRQAFKGDDDCYLALKINGKTQGAYEYEMIRAMAGLDRVLFLEATYTRAETFNFIKSLDVYVSLHRSEGFGLTCAEAMALGLPVVASNYSGNLEFMDENNSLLVPTKVIETSRPYGPYPMGTRWGDPDMEAAATMLRRLKDKSLRLDIGQRGEASVRQTLNPAKIGVIAQSLIGGPL
ncbi:MAG: glycosyltransferase [Methylovulum sp.]|nr:glycosyltransferase [Methylovulum sp.]